MRSSRKVRSRAMIISCALSRGGLPGSSVLARQPAELGPPRSRLGALVEATQALWISIQDAEAHLVAWSQFYSDGKATRIEGRPQNAVTRAIETDLFGKNNSIPWRQIGNIQSGRVQWQTLP